MMTEYMIGPREINLTQVLKGANLAESGGHAKALIEAGLVRVNGEVETRKRRQMVVGDLVEVAELGTIRLSASVGDEA